MSVLAVSPDARNAAAWDDARASRFMDGGGALYFTTPAGIPVVCEMARNKAISDEVLCRAILLSPRSTVCFATPRGDTLIADVVARRSPAAVAAALEAGVPDRTAALAPMTLLEVVLRWWATGDKAGVLGACDAFRDPAAVADPRVVTFVSRNGACAPYHAALRATGATAEGILGAATFETIEAYIGVVMRACEKLSLAFPDPRFVFRLCILLDAPAAFKLYAAAVAEVAPLSAAMVRAWGEEWLAGGSPVPPLQQDLVTHTVAWMAREDERARAGRGLLFEIEATGASCHPSAMSLPALARARGITAKDVRAVLRPRTRGGVAFRLKRATEGVIAAAMRALLEAMGADTVSFFATDSGFSRAEPFAPSAPVFMDLDSGSVRGGEARVLDPPAARQHARNVAGWDVDAWLEHKAPHLAVVAVLQDDHFMFVFVTFYGTPNGLMYSVLANDPAHATAHASLLPAIARAFAASLFADQREFEPDAETIAVGARTQFLAIDCDTCGHRCMVAARRVIEAWLEGEHAVALLADATRRVMLLPLELADLWKTIKVKRP